MLRTRAPSVSLSLEAQLQRLLAERAAAERAYLAQLAAYDAALQRLLAQKQQRSAESQCPPENAAIARLPPEILSEIASHLSSSVLPLLLVCRLWKTTLESTPALWSSLSLPAQPTAASLRALQRQLGLAKAAPLAVRVHAALCAPQHLPSYWAGMALLRGALHRVRGLEISVKDRSQLADALLHLAAPAPALRVLVLHGPHGEPLPAAHVPAGVLLGAPIRRMVLDHACVPVGTLVRDGLRDLEVTTVFHDADADGQAFEEAIARAAPTLERLAITGSQWRAAPTPRASAASTLDAPRLRELALDNAPLPELVARLRAPALRAVSLRGVAGLLDLALLRPAADALEALALADVAVQRPPAPLVLPRVAALALRLDHAAPLLDMLHLPALRTADIRQPDGAAEDAASFVAAVDALLRRSAGVRALTLRVQQSAKDALLSIDAPCAALERLHLLGVGPVLFGAPLARVRDLQLSGGCPDAASLVWAMPNVRTLAVHGVDSESVDACVCAIRGGAWAALEEVEFEHCPMMDGEGLVAAVAARAGRLRGVQLWSCGGVSSAQREEIRRLLLR
ncbi:hypothetical protein AURDEDRAFT_182305 [Auricularia subglabra TFB-10046 SS5]|nr:hypothetical protein AURDEDRAFT_182305 [Auricularia subglabra TFB-10046 SS5]